jgi:apolipoprotein N-acyltransferase
VPAFVGLVPLAVWIAGLPDGPDGRAAAARGGGLFGAVYFGILVYWILVALAWYSWWALPAYICALALLTTVGVLAAFTTHLLHHHYRMPLWAALPVAWTFGEWFRAHWPGELAFPWLGLGTALAPFPVVAGGAELVGARGLTFWLGLVNGLLAAVWLAWREGASGGGGARGKWPRVWRPLLTVVAVAVVPVLWGAWRAANLEVRPVGRVAVVQPNIPEHIKLDREVALDSTWASLNRILPALEGETLDLVVWPEVTLPDLVETRPGPLNPVAAWARRLDTPILFGAYGVSEFEDGWAGFHNSAFVMRPSGYLIRWRYDKRYLVPIVEKVPFVPARLLGGDGLLGGLLAGSDAVPVEVGGSLWGVLICYEATYPQASLAYRRSGADVLVNITNDAWYGREPWYSRTTALWQHPAHMVLRAIEHRVGVVRAANTGVSMFIDPLGRVSGELELYQAGVSVGDVYTSDVPTLYGRLGDVTGNGSAGLGILALGWFWWRRRTLRRGLGAG